ncbi:MAG: ribosome small subunit-dependent GTPase A [Aquabacterium sp.]|nr:ribosome small subunit-dependent GTPase A [Aquabacterium sp.]
MIEHIDFEALSTIGLGEAMRAQLACGVADPQARPMRLVEVQREHLLLHDGRQTHRARCSTALQRDLQAQDEALAVGDWVLARADEPGGCCITCRLLPGRRIVRRTSGGRANDARGGIHRQVLVSNVDTALLVMGLDHDFQLRRLERYLALVRLAGVAAVLVLSKADTVTPELAARRLAEAGEVLPAGMPVLAMDVRQGSAATALAAWLQPGQTLVLLGSSGAGKSTLANSLTLAFSGQADRDTGAVRADDSRGRHTTTVRTLLPLPGGACVIDTPGLRALRLDVEDADQLADAFGDVARLAPMCRFRDCQHQQEPGCAVREAVDEPRLRNFHKLLREARRDSLTQLERREQLAQWKARGRAAQARVRGKRGDAA